MRYGFGRNWQDYLANAFDEQALVQSRRHLLAMLGRDDLHGLSVLDLGCGSGIHALAAWDAGARPVVAIDYDDDSVAACRSLRASRGDPPGWQIMRGDVLDPTFMRTLAPADIVYSWGVLHHTGDLWPALEAARAKMARGGLLYVALYAAEVFSVPGLDHWLALKEHYNRAGKLGRLVMELAYIWRHFMGSRLGNWPALRRRAARYRRNRGMSLWYDVRDWLGGWPMQFCTMGEVDQALRPHGLELRRFDFGGGCTEYVYGDAESPGVGAALLFARAHYAGRPLVVVGADSLADLAFRQEGPTIIARLVCDEAGRLSDRAGGGAVTADWLAALPRETMIVLVGRHWERAAAALSALTRRQLSVCHPECPGVFPQVTRIEDMPDGPVVIIGTRPPAEALARHLNAARLAGFACVERSGRFLGRPCVPLPRRRRHSHLTPTL